MFNLLFYCINIVMIVMAVSIFICIVEVSNSNVGKTFAKIVKFADGTYAVRKPSLLHWNSVYASKTYDHIWWPIDNIHYSKVLTLKEAQALLKQIKHSKSVKKDRGITVDTE